MTHEKNEANFYLILISLVVFIRILFCVKIRND